MKFIAANVLKSPKSDFNSDTLLKTLIVCNIVMQRCSVGLTHCYPSIESCGGRLSSLIWRLQLRSIYSHEKRSNSESTLINRSFVVCSGLHAPQLRKQWLGLTRHTDVAPNIVIKWLWTFTFIWNSVGFDRTSEFSQVFSSVSDLKSEVQIFRSFKLHLRRTYY